MLVQTLMEVNVSWAISNLYSVPIAFFRAMVSLPFPQPYLDDLIGSLSLSLSLSCLLPPTFRLLLLVCIVFICTGETPWLNGKHTVFGKVTKGLDVLKKIESKGTELGRPRATVTISDCGAV